MINSAALGAFCRFYRSAPYDSRVLSFGVSTQERLQESHQSLSLRRRMARTGARAQGELFYVYKMLKQVHPDTKILSKAMAS